MVRKVDDDLRRVTMTVRLPKWMVEQLPFGKASKLVEMSLISAGVCGVRRDIDVKRVDMRTRVSLPDYRTILEKRRKQRDLEGTKK